MNVGETQQVRNSSNEEESPEPEMSRSRRRRFKASNMAFVEMVDILKRADYDGKYGPNLNPNVMCMLWKNIFTTDSAQRLIQDIMCCSRDLDIIKQKTNEVEQKLKNMVDVLGRI
ncbi:hypothetical protein AB205_0151450 [Aquarana catesbeiana]|uniref:Uncharacterized protein n=1 Tax=Aquarana catesbeiana TaxID=8400 RepID=A0A2G9R5T8_AQUCT|nr:hypothetical protein AB205_0151450 [Aquarana catesbeiana]